MAQDEQTDCDSQGEELAGVAFDVGDEGIHAARGWEADDEDGGDVVDQEAAERGIKWAGGGEDSRPGEEALAGDFLVDACLWWRTSVGSPKRRFGISSGHVGCRCGTY